MKVATSFVSIQLAQLSAPDLGQHPETRTKTMHPTTAEATVTRLRVWPAWISGPAALVAVLAIVIIALGTGLAAMIITGQGAAAMP